MFRLAAGVRTVSLHVSTKKYLSNRYKALFPRDYSAMHCSLSLKSIKWQEEERLEL
jgi:hypothetical protein